MKKPLLFVTLGSASLALCLVAGYFSADSADIFFLRFGTRAQVFSEIFGFLCRILFLALGIFLYGIEVSQSGRGDGVRFSVAYLTRFALAAAFLSLCFCFSHAVLSLFWTAVFGIVSFALTFAARKSSGIRFFYTTPVILICVLNALTAVCQADFL